MEIISEWSLYQFLNPTNFIINKSCNVLLAYRLHYHFIRNTPREGRRCETIWPDLKWAGSWYPPTAPLGSCGAPQPANPPWWSWRPSLQGRCRWWKTRKWLFHVLMVPSDMTLHLDPSLRPAVQVELLPSSPVSDQDLSSYAPSCSSSFPFQSYPPPRPPALLIREILYSFMVGSSSWDPLAGGGRGFTLMDHLVSINHPLGQPYDKYNSLQILCTTLLTLNSWEHQSSNSPMQLPTRRSYTIDMGI